MDDNIISVNVPNAISILVIVALGMVLMSIAHKFLGKRSGSISGPVSAGPTFTG